MARWLLVGGQERAGVASLSTEFLCNLLNGLHSIKNVSKKSIALRAWGIYRLGSLYYIPGQNSVKYLFNLVFYALFCRYQWASQADVDGWVLRLLGR